MIDLKKIILSLLFWIIISIILGFAIDKLAVEHEVVVGPINFHINAGLIITIALMLVTTFSLDGFTFDKKKFLNKKIAINAIVLTYIINTGITLLIGLTVLPLNKDAFYGFVILASMPCAISVITGAALSNNDQEIAVSAVFYSYLAGLILTPLISYFIIGSAAKPDVIFIYILLFIIIPVIIAKLIKPLKLKKWFKTIVVNFSLSLTVFLSINENKGPITNDIWLALLIFGIAIVRVIILHFVSKWYIERSDIGPEARTTFFVMGVWKTTGMAIAMCMVLLSSSSPFAVVPCVVSIVVEDIWFPWAANKGDAMFKKKSNELSISSR